MFILHSKHLTEETRKCLISKKVDLSKSLLVNVEKEYDDGVEIKIKNSNISLIVEKFQIIKFPKPFLILSDKKEIIQKNKTLVIGNEKNEEYPFYLSNNFSTQADFINLFERLFKIGIFKRTLIIKILVHDIFENLQLCSFYISKLGIKYIIFPIAEDAVLKENMYFLPNEMVSENVNKLVLIEI